MAETEGLHVLLVEDNPEERWIITELLRSRGHTVTACEDAETGWDAFQEKAPPLVLLDWILPGMDGLELCRRIREHQAPGTACNIVVVTSKGTATDLKAVLDAGADDYVAKPVDMALLEVRMAVAEERVRKAKQAALTRADLATKTRELEALFKNLDEVFFSIDRDGRRLIQVSPGVERLLGVAPEKLLESGEGWKEYLCPPGFEEREGIPEDSVSDAPVESEYQVRRPDGEIRWVRCKLKPGRSSLGNVIRVDGLLSDITPRKRVEQELSARNQELFALFRISEITQDASDPDEAVAEILGEVARATGFPMALLERLDPDRDCMVPTVGEGLDLDPDDPVEIPLHETLSGLVVEEGRPVAEGDARSHPRFKADFFRRLKIRSYLGLPLIGAGGVQGVLTLVDTEERKIPERLVRWSESLANSLASFLERIEAEEALRMGEQEALNLAAELQRANEELEAFAYSVSHDLRAPLRTMQGFAHALLQEYGGSLPPQARDFARRIIESGKQSEGLIRDLLAYSRMSFEEMQLQEVDLKEVLDDALEQVGGYLEEAGATLDVAQDLPRVLAHHTTLVQVMANLLSNAVKFVPEEREPHVKIGWQELKDGDRIVAWVQDNGIGVAEDQRDRIFKVFERLEGDVKRSGTGIGLAIVRRGMERIGGSVEVEPGPEGGSRFKLELPRSRGPARRGWRRVGRS